MAEILTIHMLVHSILAGETPFPGLHMYVEEYTYSHNDMHIYHIDVTHTYTKYTHAHTNTHPSK